MNVKLYTGLQENEVSKLFADFDRYAIEIGCEVFHGQITCRTSEQWAKLSKWWFDHSAESTPRPVKPKPAPRPSTYPYHSQIMKIAMMLHFACRVEPFAPEAQRTSAAYTKFIKELLADGLVERPTDEQRAVYPGWAYKATAKGKAYIEALKAVQLPVADTVWTVPS